MSELRFYGFSDDLVEVEGAFREEYPGDDITFLVSHDDGQGNVEGCHVRIRYTDEGVWAAEVSQIDEGFPIVWPTLIEAAHEYSVGLVLDVPDGFEIERLT